MPLSPGMYLGPYEILAAIGGGGMGDVYKARDTRLNRTVALKTLAVHVVGNAEMRQRFQREAKAISNLSHPNVCVLHDIGHHDGIDYLVMEYLEGETLATRLEKGPLPPEQLLRSAIEITGALAHAHRQGILHRDLKPGNIMLTGSGAKLLDFGLARVHTPEGAGAGSLVSTVAADLTQEGMIIGTLAYMAPEQLEGMTVDARTDIFSLGAVLYEMATGRRAFEGRSSAILISAIMNRDPPLVSDVQPLAPPGFDHVVQRCLAKDRDQRWLSAHDIKLELDWISQELTRCSANRVNRTQTDRPPFKLARGERIAWFSATAVLLIVSMILTTIALRHRAPTPKQRLLSMLPPQGSSFGISAVSPDGRRVVFSATDPDGRFRLWVRPFDSPMAQPLPGTENAFHPFWSPDSRSIGFFAEEKLRRIEASGGPPQELCDVSIPMGGTWNQDGVIIFARTPESGLFRIRATGGDPQPLTQPDAAFHETSHRFPFFLPNGRQYLYLSHGANSAIYIGSLDSRERTRLLTGSSNAVYAWPGYLLFVRNGTLMAQAFDAARSQFTGAAVPIAEQIGIANDGRANFSASQEGLLFYAQTGSARTTQLAWFDRGGRQIEVLGPPGLSFWPWLAPDGNHVVVDRLDTQAESFDLWIIQLARGVTTRFTFDPAPDTLPVWSPDGSRIVWVSRREGIEQLLMKPATGMGDEQVLLKSDRDKWPNDWSRDGRFLAFQENGVKTGWDLWALSMSGDQKRVPLGACRDESLPLTR